MAVEVHPATADRWDDVARVFGRRGDDPSWCWCQHFIRPEGSDSAPPTPVPEPDNRRALRHQVLEATVPPGLIAYVDGRPVGWTRVGPRQHLGGVTGNRALARVLPDDPGAWWVACFAVDSRARRSGVGSALLGAAIAFARDHGATAVVGHPVDVAALSATRVSGSAIYTGTAAMFAAAGFTEIARTYPSRPVMRLDI